MIIFKEAGGGGVVCVLAGPVPGPRASLGLDACARSRPRVHVSGHFSSEPAVASSPLPANAQLLLAEVRGPGRAGDDGDEEGGTFPPGWVSGSQRPALLRWLPHQSGGLSRLPSVLGGFGVEAPRVPPL